MKFGGSDSCARTLTTMWAGRAEVGCFVTHLTRSPRTLERGASSQLQKFTSVPTYISHYQPTLRDLQSNRFCLFHLSLLKAIFKMSDFEDEMDVDAPVADNEIKFSGESAKGKRSAANLPVEAEDSLPWYVHSLDVHIPWANRHQG